MKTSLLTRTGVLFVLTALTLSCLAGDFTPEQLAEFAVDRRFEKTWTPPDVELLK